MKTRVIHLFLVSAMILGNVGAAAAAPSASPGIEGASLGNASGSAQLVSCPPPSWQVDGVSIPPGQPDSTVGPFGAKDFAHLLTDPRTFEAKFKARAADNSGLLSILGCVFAGNCTVNKLWEKLAQIYDWASFSKGELTRTMDLSLQGAPAAKAEIRVEGSLDGLLLVSTLGVAHSRAKVTADVYAQQVPVLGVSEERNLYLSAAIFPMRITRSIDKKVTLAPGEQLHLEGYLRAEASSEDLSPFLAIGASQFFDPLGGDWFDQLNPPINIPDPGLKIKATIANVYPVVAVDRAAVFGAMAQVATNTGSFCDADGDPVTLTATIGNVVNNLDGTWTWTYVPSAGEPTFQTVIIDAKDPKWAFSSVSFQLIADNTPPITSSIFAGPQGKDNWFRSDVLVTLAATDPAGVGVARTEYSDWGVWRTYSAPLMLSDEGETTFEFRSIDAVGNVEPTQSKIIKIDKTPPAVSGSATPAPNSEGWRREPVVVHFTAQDEQSGIDIVTRDQTLGSEGAGQFVHGAAVDKAGNAARTRVDGINIDRTNPQVLIESPQARDYLRTERPKIRWTATDNLSGILTEKGLLDGSPVLNGQVLDESFVSSGTHSLTVGVVDKAGNGGGASVDFTILARADTLAESTRRVYEMGWISRRGVYKGLEALAKAAEAALERDRPAISVRLLQTYLALLKVHKGRGLNQKAYDLLRADALCAISLMR